MVIVIATVPFWIPMRLPKFPNVAFVALAAMVKCTVKPPLANCTEGSAGMVPEGLSVRLPESATGYGFARVNVIPGCDKGCAVPLTPPIVYEGSAGGSVPDPTRLMVVESTIRVPFENPRVAGAKASE